MGQLEGYGLQPVPFVIPQSLILIPHFLICHSAAKRRNLVFPLALKHFPGYPVEP